MENKKTHTSHTHTHHRSGQLSVTCTGWEGWPDGWWVRGNKYAEPWALVGKGKLMRSFLLGTVEGERQMTPGKSDTSAQMF